MAVSQTLRLLQPTTLQQLCSASLSNSAAISYGHGPWKLWLATSTIRELSGYERTLIGYEF